MSRILKIVLVETHNQKVCCKCKITTPSVHRSSLATEGFDKLLFEAFDGFRGLKVGDSLFTTFEGVFRGLFGTGELILGELLASLTLDGSFCCRSELLKPEVLLLTLIEELSIGETADDCAIKLDSVEVDLQLERSFLA